MDDNPMPVRISIPDDPRDPFDRDQLDDWLTGLEADGWAGIKVQTTVLRYFSERCILLEEHIENMTK